MKPCEIESGKRFGLTHLAHQYDITILLYLRMQYAKEINYWKKEEAYAYIEQGNVWMMETNERYKRGSK